MSSAIPCPACNGRKSAVRDSREHELGVRRRRVCGWCGYRWTTLEIAYTGRAILERESMRREMRHLQDKITQYGQAVKDLLDALGDE